MEENKELKKVESTEEQHKKPKTIGVPTQKTFVFSGSKNAKEIDSEINTWMKQQTLNGQMPMLVKMEFHKSWFTSKLVFVYMFNAPVEIGKK